MRKSLPIFAIWIATTMVLLSTVVMHHHHNERICVAFEMCVHGTDADIEAEGEANHSHRENGSCRIHQLHKFIINSSVAKNLRRHIADGNMLAAILPSDCITDTDSRKDINNWHYEAPHMAATVPPSLSRRGPPVF